VALLDSGLNLLKEVRILRVCNNQVIVHLFDPLEGLHLGVDVQGPTKTSCHEDTVLSREIISGEAILLPLSGESLRREEVNERIAL